MSIRGWHKRSGGIALGLLSAFVIAGCGGGGDGGAPDSSAACATVVDIAPTSTTGGALAAGDCTFEALFPGSGDTSLVDQYRVTLSTAGTLTLAMDSVAFDALLLLFSDLQQPPIAFDDDGGGGFNALISLSLGAGTYIIVANSAAVSAVTGAYTLTATFVPQIWQPTSLTGVPEARTEHSAVWTGSEMIIWGGNDFNANAKNTGARFNPVTNSWTPISIVDAPAGRWGHTAIWTGTEMIVWGGFSGANVPNPFQTLDDGAKYDPQTDAWTPITLTDAPSARMNHTAVWTGTEMIVWGGFSCTACVNPELATGARYDPVADMWTATPAMSAPSARGNHTAVWSGSLMIVWGGEEDTAGVVGTGAAYDPVGNAWFATNAANAPTARRCHSAVWADAEMIVFGGQLDRFLACGTSSTGTGARYDPLADAWNPIAAAPVSSTLSGAPAVWTGSQMITWFDGGARYNFATDTWNGVSTAGAPSARRRHSLLWTGSRLLVWGGDFAGVVDTGGIYNPGVDTTP
jgi:N-acetylneuraminic acid mutarotase